MTNTGSIHRIYLVGMMGSGKSHWADTLGEHYHLPAFDLDKLIEQSAGKTIRSLFEEEGEPFFRELEAFHLREKVPAEDYVLACGGGTPCYHNNMAYMKSTGLVIWLHPDNAELVTRLKRGISHRPNLKGHDTTELLSQRLTDMMADREQFYRQADIIIDKNLPGLQDIIEKIDAYTTGSL